MPLEQGQVLNNRYRIVRLLGQGGFGAVYRAWDQNLERPRAIKENLETSPEAQRQFKREAQMLADLTHPNLPKVIDHFVIPEQGQYLVMEFVEGQDLQEMLDERGRPLPEDQALDWIQQVGQALVYLHGRQPPVIHRDIKPANIRITPRGQAMLVDFGIAKQHDPGLGTTAGARAVTPGYSPLEQYGHDRHTDERTDVYALAATLYTLLTGQVPTEALERSLGATLPHPSRFNPEISPVTEATLVNALAVQPEQRTPDVTTFLKDLARSAGEVHIAPGKEVAGAQLSIQPTVRVVEEGEMDSRSQPKVNRRRTRSWLVVVLLGGLGVLLLFTLCLSIIWPVRWQSTPQVEPAQSVSIAVPTDEPAILRAVSATPLSITNSPRPAASPTPTLTEALPRIYDIIFCDRPCLDPKAMQVRGYSEDTYKVYLRFKYQNMKPGMKYIRTWSNQNQEWVRYECEWKGPQSGTFDMQLWDSMGLRSGVWVLQIEMPGYDTVRTSISIEGSYDYWLPAGNLPCADW